MGTLIRFPQEKIDHFSDSYRPEPAVILIMPVVSNYPLIDGPLLCREAFDQVSESLAAFWEAMEQV
jgi:hypothetical protein